MREKHPDYDAQQNHLLDEGLFSVVSSEYRARHTHMHSATGEHPWLGWYAGSRPTTQPLLSEFGAQALSDLPSLPRLFSEQGLWPDAEQPWGKWEYHNFQHRETFDIAKNLMGKDIEEFIRNMQAYQPRLSLCRAMTGRLQTRDYSTSQEHRATLGEAVGWHYELLFR